MNSLLKSLGLLLPPLRRLHEERNCYAVDVEKLYLQMSESNLVAEQLLQEREQLKTEVAILQNKIFELEEDNRKKVNLNVQLSTQDQLLLAFEKQNNEMRERWTKLNSRVFRNPDGEPYWSVSLESEIQHLHHKVNLLMRERKPRKRIRCLFVVHFANNWTALEPIYHAMQTAGDFEAFVAVVDYTFFGKDDMVKSDELSRMLSARNIPHLNWRSMSEFEIGSSASNYLLHELAPDIIFRQSPYDGSVPSALWTSQSSAYRICYIPYGSDIVQIPHSNVNNEYLHSAWRVFVSSAKQERYFIEESLVGANNVRVTGNPRLDTIASRQKMHQCVNNYQTILWAPHHSVGNDWLSFGTFPSTCWEILDFAKNSPNIKFILRGHHILYKTLLNMGAMTAKDILSFQNEWSALQNTSIDEDACYVDSFIDSDILLCDGVSFLAEYQVTGKPVVFIEREGHVDFNVLGKLIIEGVYRVPSAQEAITQICALLKGGEDPLRHARTITEAELRPYPGVATERVLDEIRRGLVERV